MVKARPEKIGSKGLALRRGKQETLGDSFCRVLDQIEIIKNLKCVLGG